VLVGAVALALVSLVAPRAARADESANCTVTIIHALHEEGGIDPKITRLRKLLETDSFAAFKSFQLLEEKKLQVKVSGSDRIALPNGKQATLTYLEHLKQADGRTRLRLKLEIEDGGKKLLSTTIGLEEGKPFVQAGQKHGKGLLVLGFACEAAK
jgi:hypothetical protein